MHINNSDVIEAWVMLDTALWFLIVAMVFRQITQSSNKNGPGIILCITLLCLTLATAALQYVLDYFKPSNGWVSTSSSVVSLGIGILALWIIIWSSIQEARRPESKVKKKFDELRNYFFRYQN